MRFQNNNPLDQIPAPAVPVVLVHTQSFVQDIIGGDPKIYQLMKIASLGTCPIVFTPINDLHVQAILIKQQMDVAQYYLEGNQYIVKCRYMEAVFSLELDPLSGEVFQQESGYSLNDHMLIGSSYFHFHVSKMAPRSTELDVVLDILQVYHIKNGIFKPEANTSIGQFFYDMISVNKQIPEYKRFFIEFQHLRGAYPSNADTIENLLQSLHDRMMLMNKAAMELKYQSLRSVTNNASTEIMYHLSYFVILITGSFDNLAWIVNYIYVLGFSLNASNRNNVKLQNVYKPQNKPTEAFYKALSVKAPHVSAFFLLDKVSCLIDFIYPLRDAIQHRSFIKPLTVTSNNRKSDKLLIWFPDDVKIVLQRYFNPEEFGFDRQTSGRMMRDYYDIYIFSKKLHGEITKLVNEVCSIINLTSVFSVSQQQLQVIAASIQSSKDDPFVGLKIQQAMAY